MTFFYDLNKRLAALATKQDAKQIAEDAKATAPKSKLAESIEVAERATGDYSAKKGAAGKDLGKPGKNFDKIASKSGGGEKGQRIAGAVLNKLRGKNEGVDKEAFAKLAPPADKITFADKIAGAKKEVDEMLGDVAADAMRKAITSRGGEVTKTSKGIKHRSTNAYGGTKDEPADNLGNLNKGRTSGLEKGMGVKFGKKNRAIDPEVEVEEGFGEMDAWLKSREKEKGTGKFDKKERTLPGGMKATTYTRKHEDDKEDDSDAPSAKGGAPKKRGRPMGKPKGPERTTAKAWKHKGERVAEEDDEHVCEQCGQPIAEKAKSKKQQKFMGMVHATQKGEKAPSKEVAKVAKTMKKSDAKDFASTKQKGLPEKVKAKKESKEDVEETTTSGSVATAAPSGKAKSGGMQFGKGVYESLDRQFKQALTESVNVAETISENEGEGKTITVTASGPEADMLMQLLKAAGLSGQGSDCGCGQSPCGCNELDENQPDWPTDQVTSNDALQYSGGLNKPKSTGQTTTPVIASQLNRQVSMEESVELERSLFKTWKNYKG